MMLVFRIFTLYRRVVQLSASPEAAPRAVAIAKVNAVQSVKNDLRVDPPR